MTNFSMERHYRVDRERQLRALLALLQLQDRRELSPQPAPCSRFTNLTPRHDAALLKGGKPHEPIV